MKKLVVMLVALLVILLPRLVDAQEPTNNGTVPYTVWLPVVRVELEGRCDINMDYRSLSDQAGGFYHIITFFMSNEFESPEAFGGDEIAVASDIAFQDIIATGGDKDGYIIPGVFRILLSGEKLIPGQTYYARLKYTCYGVSTCTSALVFVASSPELTYR